jgi:hypothetical protein
LKAAVKANCWTARVQDIKKHWQISFFSEFFFQNCIFNDDNAEKLVLRIRIMNADADAKGDGEEEQVFML